MSQVQYITDEQGGQVSVILDIKDYHNLIAKQPDDAEILTELSQSELQALADSTLAPSEQKRLDALLARNNADELNDTEASELEQLLNQIDQLTILKTRARYTLCRRVIEP